MSAHGNEPDVPVTVHAARWLPVWTGASTRYALVLACGLEPLEADAREHDWQHAPHHDVTCMDCRAEMELSVDDGLPGVDSVGGGRDGVCPAPDTPGADGRGTAPRPEG